MEALTLSVRSPANELWECDQPGPPVPLWEGLSVHSAVSSCSSAWLSKASFWTFKFESSNSTFPECTAHGKQFNLLHKKRKGERERVEKKKSKEIFQTLIKHYRKWNSVPGGSQGSLRTGWRQPTDTQAVFNMWRRLVWVSAYPVPMACTYYEIVSLWLLASLELSFWYLTHCQGSSEVEVGSVGWVCLTGILEVCRHP